MDVYPLTINYGQAHSRELRAAEAVADSLGVKTKIVNLPDLSGLAFHSALTGRPSDLPLGRSESEMGQDIPISYVPMRNSMFLAMASSYMEALALDQIEQRGDRPESLSIVIGANAIDYSGYPDCREEYLQRMMLALNSGSKVWTEYQLGFDILSPLVKKTKVEIAKLGMDLGLDPSLTYSCYRGQEEHCGYCDSCQIRNAALTEAAA